ncbi:hypothetical protein MKEN_00633300 [Mycena kentingensis (nom. inval.)]|nr:hypothetical protein MKEN_00633300 [Mycena kentingensis (nom. inval.)]
MPPTTKLPAAGSFSRFTLDPLLTVDSRVLDDPIAVQALRALPCKSYVGYVSRRIGIWNPSAEYNISVFHFLRKGEPEDVPADFTTPSMAMHIADTPSVSAQVPQKQPSSDRPAFIPSNAFPWKSDGTTYTSIWWTIPVRSCTAREQTPPQWTLSEPDHHRFCVAYFQDVRARDAAEYTAVATQREAAVAVPTVDAADADERSSNWEQTPSFPDPSDDADSIDADMHAAIFPDATNLSSPMETGTFSHDLSSLTEFPDPLGLCTELEAIVQIEEESLARMSAASPAEKEKSTKLDAKWNAKTSALGTFAKFKLDPVASTDPITRADPVAMKELEELAGKVGEYAGLVGVTLGRLRLWNPTSHYNAVHFYLIRPNPPYQQPPELEADFGDSPMCTPLTPASSSHRTALEPTLELPWPPTEAYLGALWSMQIRSPTAVTFEEPHWHLPMD